MRFPHRAFAMVTITTLLVSGAIGGPVGAADLETRGGGRVNESTAWGVVRSPNRGSSQNSLKGIAAISNADIWAVGEYRPDGPCWTCRRTLIEHWDGSRWRLVPSPNPTWEGLDYATLEDVDEVTSDDVWAVGYSEDFSTLRLNTLVQHWDGAQWRIVPSPNPAGTNFPNELYGVEAVASNDVWAVGEAGTNGRALILHWNGTSWKTVQNGCGTYANLRGIAAVSKDDIWAVGDATTCHYNGSTWTLVPSPQPRPEYDEIGYPLQAVSAASPTDVWAVGSRAIDTVYSVVFSSLTEHWDGQGWTAVYNVPGVEVSDVTAVAANDVWGVGTYSLGTLIVHWNGSRWAPIPSPDPGIGGALNGIDRAGPDFLWSAGSFYGETRQRTLVVQAPSSTQGAVVGDTRIAHAVVSWFGRVDGSDETDVFGRYEAPGLPAGDYLFTASNQGCKPDSARVSVVAGTTVIQDLHPQC